MIPSFTQTLRIMRLIATIMLVTAMHVSAKTISQTTVTFTGKNVAVKEIFTAIKKQTGYVVFYDKDLLKQSHNVTVSLVKIPLEEFLKIVLKDQPLDYTIKDRTIFISKKEQQKNSKSEKDSPPVTGIVRGPDGQPLAGVNVMIKGTKKGTVTDKDGKFSIEAEAGAELEISSIGFGKKTLTVSSSREIFVALEIASSILDEVQYIAYGQTSKRFNVGNIGTVKSADIEKQPVQNPLLALQGRIPGVVITQNTGVPNGGVTVRIQGQNSIANGSDPFYVIDGVPYLSQIPETQVGNPLGNSGGLANGQPVGAGSPLSYINVNDIESIEILKDADATAIYGSRAANGAILITTKKGKVGKTTIDFSIQQGWGKITRKVDMLNAQQYLEVRKEAINNDNLAIEPTDYDVNGIWDTTRNTDWQKALIGGTAQLTTADASISGGTSTMQYLVGGTFQRQTTVFPGNFSDKRASMHYNINSGSTAQKLRIQFTGSYLIDDNKLPSTDITRTAILLEPNAPALYDENGNLNWMPDAGGTSTWTNPMADILYRTYSNQTKNLLSNTILEYQLTSYLKMKSNFGYNSLHSDEFQVVESERSIKPEERAFVPRIATYGDRNITSWIIEPQITYSKKFGIGGDLEALLGTSIQQNAAKGQMLIGIGYNSDIQMEDILSASSVFVQNSFVSKYRYNALFGRLNYKLKDRYIINATGRRDGSSRFGFKSQFHNFGSLGAGWIFSEEKILGRVKFLSFGKLKASYGTVGNDQIPDYSYLNLYQPVSSSLPYQGIGGVAPRGLDNPYLEWEATRKMSVGLELSLFQNQIWFETNFARNTSSNQLLSYIVPTVTGFQTVTRNFPATVENKSWEILVRYTIVDGKALLWTTNFNLTIPRNKLIAFPNLESSSYNSTLVIGQPLNVIKLYHSYGVDPLTGQYIVSDAKGDATNNPDPLLDNRHFVTPSPKYYGGFHNSITFKNLTIDFLIQFVRQKGANKLFQGTVSPGRFVNGFSNQPVSVLDRWQEPGDTRLIAKYSTRFMGVLPVSSDAGYSDASYARLKNVSISYELIDKWKQAIRLRTCRVFVQGQNLLTVTKYKGLDPENQGNLYAEISLTPLRFITAGVQVGF